MITVESNSHLSLSHPDDDITVRIERFEETLSFSDAFSYLSKFYKESGSEGTGVHEYCEQRSAKLPASPCRTSNRIP